MKAKTQAIEVNSMAAQGDVIFRRVASIPRGFTEAKRAGDIIVAHSETGHHHSIADKGVTLFEDPKSSLVCYLRMDLGVEVSGGATVEHHRPWDTHRALKLLGKPGDIWEVRRQREHTPEGWRRVED